MDLPEMERRLQAAMAAIPAPTRVEMLSILTIRDDAERTQDTGGLHLSRVACGFLDRNAMVAQSLGPRFAAAFVKLPKHERQGIRRSPRAPALANHLDRL